MSTTCCPPQPARHLHDKRYYPGGAPPAGKSRPRKGLTRGLFGLWVLAASMSHAVHGSVAAAVTMDTAGFVALLVNAALFALLWAYRLAALAYLAAAQAAQTWPLPPLWVLSPCIAHGMPLAGAQ